MGLVRYLRERKERKRAKLAARTRAECLFFGGVSMLMYVIVVAGLVTFTPTLLSRTLNTQYPIAAITSSSMWPELQKGDLVMIQGIDPTTLAVGDIIVYMNELNAFTIHRIIEKNESTITTKGDANNTKDKPITYDKVVGRLYSIGEWHGRLPKLGYLSMMVGDKFSS